MTLEPLFVLEMIGTAVFAISGALAASRAGMDIFGFSVLALMPAVGGGTFRDIMLGRFPVFWIENNSYVAVAILAAIVIYFFADRPGFRKTLLIWMDAPRAVRRTWHRNRSRHGRQHTDCDHDGCQYRGVRRHDSRHHQQ